MATDPISGARYALETDSGDVALWLQRAVNDLSTQLMPRYASTGARDTAFAAAITAGTISSIANGSMSIANGVKYRRIGGNWREDRARVFKRIVVPTSPANSIAAGGASETGITSGATALASFTLYEACTMLINGQWRAGSATGVAACTVKVDGAQAGITAFSRTDGTVMMTTTLALAAGSHTVSMRVDGSTATISWVDGCVTFSEGIAE